MLENRICENCGSEMTALFYTVFCDCQEAAILNGDYWLGFTAGLDLIDKDCTVPIFKFYDELDATLTGIGFSSSTPIFPVLCSAPIEWQQAYGNWVSIEMYSVKSTPCFSTADNRRCFVYETAIKEPTIFTFKDGDVIGYA